MTPAYVVQVLTAGLPAEPVNSPFGFVRRRLREKKPPHRPSAPAPGTTSPPAPRLMVECTDCGAPGRPEALPDGLCHACRTPPPGAPTTIGMDARAMTAHDTHTRVEALRVLMRTS